MFKFVVLCAFLAAGSAEPSAYLTQPLTTYAAPLTYSGAYAPAATYISHAGGYAQPAFYSTPYGYSHLIKKRSAPIAYSTGYYPSTYLASAPLTTTYSGPLVSSASYYPLNAPVTYTTAAHFIKKRSAPLAYPATYFAPTTYAATSPYLTTAYSTPYYTTPYVSGAPLTYPAHFIKKRSVALAYAAPAAVSHQSRVDYSGPVVSSYAAVSPLGYAAASPIAYTAAVPYAGTFAAPIPLK